MTESVENLTLEHSRAVRADMARMASSMRTMTAEMSVMRQHVRGIATLPEHDHAGIAEIKSRLDRVERRLDLVD